MGRAVGAGAVALGVAWCLPPVRGSTGRRARVVPGGAAARMRPAHGGGAVAA